MMMSNENSEKIESDFVDPADYLFAQTEFHDCHLKVGDPATGEVEEVGVVRSQLVAHSSVFRGMLMSSGIADPSGGNTHIRDVRPEIFRLMLKHMYGGKLLELNTMEKEKILELAFCADKYNVQRLVEKASKKMMPRTVDDVFIPLRFVAYVPTSVLVPPVTKLIQEETDKIVKHNDFVYLDENCLEFIAKQDKLAIDEISLFKALVKWAEHQDPNSNLTMRQLLEKPLAHVRFASFPLDGIIYEVIPTGIFSTITTVKPLINSLMKPHLIDIPGLCTNLKQREKFIKDSLMLLDVDMFKNESERTLSPSWQGYSCQEGCELRLSNNLSNISMLTVHNLTPNLLAIESFVFRSKNYFQPNMCSNHATYKYFCAVTIVCYDDKGYAGNSLDVAIEGIVVFEENIVMPLKSSDGKYCIFEPNKSYKVCFKFESAHPVSTFVGIQTQKILKDCYIRNSDVEVKFCGRNVHVLSIGYKLLTS